MKFIHNCILAHMGIFVNTNKKFIITTTPPGPCIYGVDLAERLSQSAVQYNLYA